MKKIINGKMYNTESAKEIGKWTNEIRGFAWCEEVLYKNVKGAFFLNGRGGARSIYSKHCGDSECDGEKIIPITEEEAKNWMEQKESAEKYIEEFGEPGEADPKL